MRTSSRLGGKQYFIYRYRRIGNVGIFAFRLGNDGRQGVARRGAGTHMPFSSGRFLAGSISRQTCSPLRLKNTDIAHFFLSHSPLLGVRPPAATSLRRHRFRLQKNAPQQRTLLYRRHYIFNSNFILTQ